MPEPIYLFLIFGAIILFSALILFKNINNKVKDVNTRASFFDQKMDSVRAGIIDVINQRYTDIMTELKKINPPPESTLPSDSADDDELYKQAKRLVIEAGKASASFLQRRLMIGYVRAARLLDMLEAEGVIGPAVDSEPREVLKSKF